MYFCEMTDEQVHEMRRKRHAYFSAIAEKYETFEAFTQANEEWLAVMGIALWPGEEYLSLHMQLDYPEYERYHVIPGPNGKLTVSHVIWCEYLCANMLFNIFTESYDVDEEDILTQY